MSESDDDAPPEVDREELIEDAAEHKAEQDEKHATLLEAAAEGEEAIFTEAETVELGMTEITAKTSVPGHVMRSLDPVFEGDVAPGKMLDTLVDALTAQTERVAVPEEGIGIEDEADIRRFWRDWLNAHDVEAGAELAFERVIEEPADINKEAREEAMHGFRTEG